MAQILGGTAEEYLSYINLWQAKASWFYSLYSDLQEVFGDLEGAFGERWKFQTIKSLNLKAKQGFTTAQWRQGMPDPHMHVELHPLTLPALKAGSCGLHLGLPISEALGGWGDTAKEWIPAHNPNKQTYKHRH